VRQHQGYFERAAGGTLLLDEITEMPLDLQTKMLRVLETGRMVRVGGTEEIAVDVRIVTASNHPPEAILRDRRLREDLFLSARGIRRAPAAAAAPGRRHRAAGARVSWSA
jgi:transcriptional regulator with PAS, ATPase and Fis domain